MAPVREQILPVGAGLIGHGRTGALRTARERDRTPGVRLPAGRAGGVGEAVRLVVFDDFIEEGMDTLMGTMPSSLSRMPA